MATKRHVLRWSNGKVKEEGDLVDGKKEGEWCHYSELGRLITRCNYQHDHLHGLYEEFYHTHDDRPSSVGKYQFGKQHGPWTYFFLDGSVKTEGSYYKGRKVGTWSRRRDESEDPFVRKYILLKRRRQN